jgi:hypothetical protein
MGQSRILEKQRKPGQTRENPENHETMANPVETRVNRENPENHETMANPVETRVNKPREPRYLW